MDDNAAMEERRARRSSPGEAQIVAHARGKRADGAQPLAHSVTSDREGGDSRASVDDRGRFLTASVVGVSRCCGNRGATRAALSANIPIQTARARAV